MDYQFPQQLFPSFYNRGPPDTVLKHCAGNWGCYDLVRPQVGQLSAEHAADHINEKGTTITVNRW